MIDTVLSKSIFVSYGAREEKETYFSSSGTVIPTNYASLIQAEAFSLGIDDEMRDIENAAIWDFWNFETLD